jgi:hypothetical protein
VVVGDPDPDPGTGRPGFVGSWPDPDVGDEAIEPGGVEPAGPAGFDPIGPVFVVAIVVGVAVVGAEVVDVMSLAQMLAKSGAAVGGGSVGLPCPGSSNRHPSTSPVCMVRLAPALEYVHVPGSPCQ